MMVVQQEEGGDLLLTIWSIPRHRLQHGGQDEAAAAAGCSLVGPTLSFLKAAKRPDEEGGSSR